jgi:hypothetical protein
MEKGLGQLRGFTGYLGVGSGTRVMGELIRSVYPKGETGSTPRSCLTKPLFILWFNVILHLAANFEAPDRIKWGAARKFGVKILGTFCSGLMYWS